MMQQSQRQATQFVCVRHRDDEDEGGGSKDIDAKTATGGAVAELKQRAHTLTCCSLSMWGSSTV